MQMRVRKVKTPVYEMPYGLDNASYVSAAGILRYYIMTEKDPYVFMESDQPLPGLFERSDQRGRQELRRPERRIRETDDGDEYEEEEAVYDNRDNNGGNYYGNAEDEIYEDDEDNSRRENLGEFMRNLAEKFKKLF